MFYARISKQNGRMIKLISSVLVELSIFMVFFSFWNLMFCWLTRIAGQDVEDDDYTNLGINIIFFINVFRNSMGDVQTPKTTLWNNYLDETMSGDRYSSNSYFSAYIMIYYIWVLWFVQIIFMCIILLNLLISIIS
jgi:hypothetical protein